MAAKDDLAAAVKKGDVDGIQALVAKDPALASARDEQGVSMVLLALYHRQRAAAEALLAARPPLDVFEAAAAGQLDRLRALLDVDRESAKAWASDGFFPLALACFFGQPEAAQLLLAAGADVRAAARNPMRVTALHAAAAARNTPAARLLLERGAEVDARQQAGYTTLHAAAQHGDVELVDLLLAHGADPTLRSEDGQDAADHARANGHEALAARLAAVTR